MASVPSSPVAFEDLAASQLHLVLLAQPHLDAWEWQADAPGPARTVVGIRDHDSTFRDAVALDRLLAQQALAALEQRRRQRGRAGDEDSDVGQVGRVLVEPVAQALVHGRHAEEHGPALVIRSRELRDYGRRREVHQRCARSAEQRPVQAHAEAVEMEERQRVDKDVIRRPAPNLHRPATLREESAVVDDRALRATCRAGGVHDRREALGRQVGHRGRGGTGQFVD